MDIKTYFKKYGILTIVAIIFIAAIGYFVYDSTQGVIPGKKVNGEDVLVAMDGYTLTVDELYEEMLDGDQGKQVAYMYFTRAVADQCVETTEEMLASAKENAEYIAQQLSQYGEDTLNAQLRNAGLRSQDELVNYYLSYFKLQELVNNYVEANELQKKYFEENKGRYVSHILVKCEDADNPTAAEKEKMAKVDAALAAGTSFADVATEYSDDGSASNGGELGYADANTSYVESFLNAMLAANEGEVTEWVKSQYGYHKIVVSKTSYEDLKDDESFLEAFNNAYSTLEYEVVYAASRNLDISFGNEKVEELLNELFTEVLGGNE